MIDRRVFTTTLGAAALAGPAIGSERLSDRSVDVASFGSEFLSLEGRVARLPNGSWRAGFPGVVVRAQFHGPVFILHSIVSSATQWVDVVVDGGVPKTVHLTPDQPEIAFFEGASGEHTVEIGRRNESWQGVWDLFGARAPGGRFLRPARLPDRRLLFIGDSITCGEASDVARDDVRLDLGTADAQRSYAKLLAKALGAQCHLVSYGGRGLIRDWQGRRDTANAPQFYTLAAPDEPTALWDPETYVPDVVGVMLGTNDFSQGAPDRAEFTDAFVRFVQTMQADAPAASILLMDSPILDDTGSEAKKTVLRSYLQEIGARCASPLVRVLPLRHYTGRPVNAHPTAEDHIGIAAEVEPAFRRALGLGSALTASSSSS